MTHTFDVQNPPSLAAWETSPRAYRTRVLLGDAEKRLEAAREALSGDRYTAALPHLLASFRAALRAFLAWDAAEMEDTDASLEDLADRVVRLSSVFKTPAHRACLLDARAAAIEGASQLSVHDLEDVETGSYTARNLIATVRSTLPAAFRMTPPAPAEA